MKRWGLLVCFIYVATLLALAYPLAAVCWGEDLQPSGVQESMGFWLIWLGVMLVGQVSLLFLPIKPKVSRPRSRRRLIFPVIVTSLLTGVLHLLLITDIAIAFMGDKGLGWFGAGLVKPNGYLLTGVCAYIWVFWGLIFWWFSRRRSEDTVAKRILQWLFIGSALELLVAVPTHVACRQRDDCCAPMASFLGIATGIAIMLMCFGPGVFWLYVERVRRKRAGSNSTDSDSTPTSVGEQW